MTGEDRGESRSGVGGPYVVGVERGESGSEGSVEEWGGFVCRGTVVRV